MRLSVMLIFTYVFFCGFNYAPCEIMAAQAKKPAAAKQQAQQPAKQNSQPVATTETEQDKGWPEGPAGDAAAAYSKGDFAKAREIWEKMANDGDGQAMNNLGVLYDLGKGVEADPGRAANWFAKAANAGNPSGMSNYGRMLEQGRGIAANVSEAARWFDQAARQGQPEAQYNLGYLYEHGYGVPRNDKAAAAWYSRAASQQQKEALARLGHFYRIGKGVDEDREKATLLLYAAAMEGSIPAIGELDSMAKELPQKAPPVLFGQKLDETSREAMRASLKKSGVVVKRENDANICDVYEGSPVVPGASEMAICYSPEGKLGFIKIDYAAQDKKKADAVISMVESRFGKPHAGEGEDSRLWNLGSIMVATQYAPTHQQISLMYMAPKVYHLTRAN